mmetsp:Transcript_727/g.1408  ORF Transcript_727/g.1408 Transcript_727/m.1408 type:complete len:100 (+) Transcript_727:1189-1488(+)
MRRSTASAASEYAASWRGVQPLGCARELTSTLYERRTSMARTLFLKAAQWSGVLPCPSTLRLMKELCISRWLGWNSWLTADKPGMDAKGEDDNDAAALW